MISKKNKPGPEQQGPRGKKGFIIIQIDGLSYEDFLRASYAKKTKFLSKILSAKSKNPYLLKQLHSGLPSDTPYFQACLFYNDGSKIPGFRYFIKNENKKITFKSPANTRFVEEKYYKKDGLLKGGSCYISLFAGGAKRTLFTVARSIQKDYDDRIFGLWSLIKSIFNIPWAIRLVFLCIKETLVEIRDFIIYAFKRKTQRAEWVFPFERIFNNIIFREAALKSIKEDVKNGIKKIYVDFNIYDETSHQRGPAEKLTYSTLKDIDLAVKKIFKYARKSKKTDYDLYVLSDHGETPSYPFTWRNGESFENFVKNAARENISNEKNNPRRWDTYFIKLIVSTPLLRRVFSGKVPGTGPERKEEQVGKHENIIVRYSCCMANIYFTELPDRAFMEEAEKEFPGLINKIINHKDIGFAAARTKNGKIIKGSGGEVIIPDKGKNIIRRENPLAGYGNEKQAVKDLCSLLDRSFSGDIIVMGAFKNGEIINFEEQMSAHGGLGGPQTSAFIIYPEEIKAPETGNIKGIHGIFKGYTG